MASTSGAARKAPRGWTDVARDLPTQCSFPGAGSRSGSGQATRSGHLDLLANDSDRIDANTRARLRGTGPGPHVEGPGVQGAVQEVPVQIPLGERTAPVGAGVVQ